MGQSDAPNNSGEKSILRHWSVGEVAAKENLLKRIGHIDEY